MKPKKATVKGASDLVKGGKSPIEDFIPSAKYVGARYGYTHKSVSMSLISYIAFIIRLIISVIILNDK